MHILNIYQKIQKMCRNSMQKRTAWSLLSACNLGSQRVKHWTAGKTKTGACIRYNARKLSEAQNMQWHELPLTSLMICLWISELCSDPLALIVQRNVLAIKGGKQCELKNIKGLWENNFDWRKKQTLMSFFFTSAACATIFKVKAQRAFTAEWAIRVNARGAFGAGFLLLLTLINI